MVLGASDIANLRDNLMGIRPFFGPNRRQPLVRPQDMLVGNAPNMDLINLLNNQPQPQGNFVNVSAFAPNMSENDAAAMNRFAQRGNKLYVQGAEAALQASYDYCNRIESYDRNLLSKAQAQAGGQGKPNASGNLPPAVLNALQLLALAGSLQQNSLAQHSAAFALLKLLLSQPKASTDSAVKQQIAAAQSTEQASAKQLASANVSITININIVNSTKPNTKPPVGNSKPTRQKLRGEHLPPPTWFFNSNRMYQQMARNYCAQKTPVVDSLCQQIDALNQSIPA